MFSRFGRQIFHLYEKRPFLMNSVVGGAVYIAGEYTIQTKTKDVRFFDDDNWKKLAQLGALGSAENGIIMLKWYELLNRYVGSGVGTPTVLLKCLLDQIFFATQQDALFLGLCAWSDSEVLAEAVQEVKDTFLTTWIVDCALWPVVNFVGFAFIPYIYQPTYMAFVSYFWQLYLSATAAGSTNDLSDHELEALFRVLDTDNSKFIDAEELHAFFKQRDINVSPAEVRQMIADADLMGRNIRYKEFEEAGQLDRLPEPDDGLVSLEEFMHLARHGQALNLKSSALWSSVRQDILLTKGAKHAMKRLEEVQHRHREEKIVRKVAEEAAEVKRQRVKQAEALAEAQAKAEVRTQSSVFGTLTAMLFGQQAAQAVVGVGGGGVGLGVGADGIPEGHSAGAGVRTAVAREALEAEERAADRAHIRQVEAENRTRELAEERADAVHKATIGGAVLAAAVLVRVAIFKV